MINHLKLDKLQQGFLKLTEPDQHYVLGLAEGLKHTQEKENPLSKIPGSNSATVFYTRSYEQGNCS